MVLVKKSTKTSASGNVRFPSANGGSKNFILNNAAGTLIVTENNANPSLKSKTPFVRLPPVQPLTSSNSNPFTTNPLWNSAANKNPFFTQATAESVFNPQQMTTARVKNPFLSTQTFQPKFTLSSTTTRKPLTTRRNPFLANLVSTTTTSSIPKRKTVRLDKEKLKSYDPRKSSSSSSTMTRQLLPKQRGVMVSSKNKVVPHPETMLLKDYSKSFVTPLPMMKSTIGGPTPLPSRHQPMPSVTTKTPTISFSDGEGITETVSMAESRMSTMSERSYTVTEPENPLQLPGATTKSGGSTSVSYQERRPSIVANFV